MKKSLWKLDFMLMIFVKEKRKTEIIVYKGKYMLTYRYHKDDNIITVTFKKDEMLHRDDDKPSSIVFYDNFMVKSKTYYYERVLCRITDRNPRRFYVKSQYKILY